MYISIKIKKTARIRAGQQKKKEKKNRSTEITREQNQSWSKEIKREVRIKIGHQK